MTQQVAVKVPAADLYVGAGNVVVFIDPEVPGMRVRRMAANTKDGQVEVLFYVDENGHQETSFPSNDGSWHREFKWVPAEWIVEVDGQTIEVVL